MKTKSIDELIAEFSEKYKIRLSKLPRKRIIYEARVEGKSIVVVMPYSKIYPKGNGWVDFTKEQIITFKRYQHAIAIFRLSNGNTYYVDMEKLFPLLTKGNMMVNDREGEHWKLDIWNDKIVPRKSQNTLYVKPDDKSALEYVLQSIGI